MATPYCSFGMYNWRKLLLGLSLALFGLPQLIWGQCDRRNDSLELVKLYNATDGPNWTNKWDLKKPMNQWYGVYLSSAGCVTDLYLTNNGLKGNIPNFNLPNLRNLSLAANQLIGNIPNFNFPNLATLRLDINKLTGSIPNFNMPNLYSLELYGNQLSGSIPDFNMLYLQSLILYDNQLTGSIPNFNMPKLTSLWISNNQLSGSIPSFNLPNLENLNLTYNQLSGSIPDFNMPKLRFIYLSENKLAGSIPNFNLPNLEFLSLENNQLTGNIPNFNMPKLRSLSLFENQLSGSIPDFNLPNLTHLSMSKNQLTGSIPNFNMPKLEYLNLSLNELSGNIPNFNLPNLNQLFLIGNQLSGNIPNFNLPSLTTLYLFENRLTGSVPDFNLPNLISLRLDFNQLTGSIPNFNLPKLEYLNLSLNELSGSIPNFNLPKLIELQLEDNQLKGSIPNFNLPNLLALKLYSNQLTGSIPNFNLPKLFSFLIYKNQLTFEDLTIYASFIAQAKIVYSPQDSIYRDTTIYVTVGQSLNVDLGIDANLKDNLYVWYKNNQAYDTISGSNKLNFAAMKTTDAGIYHVVVTNPNAPALKLYGRKIRILAASDTTGCANQDRKELIKLYNATNGPNWDSTWNFNLPNSRLFGVKVNTQGCVTCIDLDGIPDCKSNGLGNKLYGNLPSLNLPYLEELYLFKNRLYGKIPDLSLPNLKVLVLSSNDFSGTLPRFNLPNLEQLYISANELEGPIPDFYLPKLKSLYLNSNTKLTGNIPNFKSENLVDLVLYNNQLSGNIPNFNLPNLERLRLHNNKLSGDVPDLKLHKLNDLTLHNNDLKNIAKLTVLTKLGLTTGDSLTWYGNKFTFDDIIPNLSLINDTGSKAKYAPQARVIILDSIRNATAGQSHSINLGIDESLPQDSPNTYFWEKDGKPYDTLIGVNRLTFPRLKISDAGWYTFRGTNPKAPQLTLYGNRIRINVSCPASMNSIAIAASPSSPCEGDTLKLSIDKKLYTNIRWSNGQTTPEITPKLTQTATLSLTATDTLGCANTGSKTINVFRKPKLMLFQTTENCADRLDPEVDGGTPSYRYAWSTNSTASFIRVNNIGNYSLTITDANNCKVADTIKVTSASKRFILKDSLHIMPTCDQADGAIWLSLSPRNQPYTYQWSPATIGQGENPRTQLVPGEYKVVIRNAQGCTDSLKIELPKADCSDKFQIFSSFTPNRDNVNETFEIKPISCAYSSLAACFPNNELMIFNRYNHVIYRASPYDNKWDGENYPTGAYLYIFYPDKKDRKNCWTGWLTLLR